VLLDARGAPLRAAHPLTMYQGLLHADPGATPHHRRIGRELAATQAFVGALLERYAGCCLSQSWRFGDLRGFLWYHYHEPERGRFAVDVGHAGVLDVAPYASFDAYLAAVRTVRRYEYRKARAAVEVRDLDDLDVLDALHAKTFARQGLAREAHEARLVRAVARAACAGGYGALRGAWVDGRPASAALFLFDDRTAYYLVGANDPAYRDSYASTVLLFEMIRGAMARGAREVDFVGVNSPARGDYKVSFNAQVHPYFVLRYGA
jgi:hypothetical protein